MPIKRRKGRVIGMYDIPYIPHLYAVELIIPAPPSDVDFSEFWPYHPPMWVRDGYVGKAHFYLSNNGEELIGSYLDDDSLEGERGELSPYEFYLKRRNRITRAVLLMGELPHSGFDTIWGRMRIPRDTTALPERLLRLIWVEDGLPGQGADQAYLDG